MGAHSLAGPPDRPARETDATSTPAHAAARVARAVPAWVMAPVPPDDESVAATPSPVAVAAAAATAGGPASVAPTTPAVDVTPVSRAAPVAPADAGPAVAWEGRITSAADGTSGAPADGLTAPVVTVEPAAATTPTPADEYPASVGPRTVVAAADAFVPDADAPVGNPPVAALANHEILVGAAVRSVSDGTAHVPAPGQPRFSVPGLEHVVVPGAPAAEEPVAPVAPLRPPLPAFVTAPPVAPDPRLAPVRSVEPMPHVEPVAEQPVAEQPVAEQPVAEQPVAEQPAPQMHPWGLAPATGPVDQVVTPAAELEPDTPDTDRSASDDEPASAEEPAPAPRRARSLLDVFRSMRNGGTTAPVATVAEPDADTDTDTDTDTAADTMPVRTVPVEDPYTTVDHESGRLGAVTLVGTVDVRVSASSPSEDARPAVATAVLTGPTSVVEPAEITTPIDVVPVDVVHTDTDTDTDTADDRHSDETFAPRSAVLGPDAVDPERTRASRGERRIHLPWNPTAVAVAGVVLGALALLSGGWYTVALQTVHLWSVVAGVVAIALTTTVLRSPDTAAWHRLAALLGLTFAVIGTALLAWGVVVILAAHAGIQLPDVTGIGSGMTSGTGSHGELSGS